MNISILMPQLGLTMEEGTVSAWLKKTGDVVKKSEPLFAVTTDKVEMEVEAVANGTLGEILVPQGQIVPVGTVLAYLEVAGSEGAATVGHEARPAAPAVEKGTPQPSPAGERASSANQGGNVSRSPRQWRASPRAKRLAKELGVDLGAVQGRGDDGEISEDDIRRAAAPTDRTSQQDSSRRRLIAERLTRSIQTIPTFSVAVEVNAENFVALYASLKKQMANAAARERLTITDLLLFVFAKTLHSSPEVNAAWEDDGIRNRTSVDIGLAVATAKGVVAPVMRGVDHLDLQALVERRSELVDKARQGRLSLAELEGGVGTLSNLGMYRVDQFQAIISPGQSSILAVGQMRDRPWVVDKQLTVKPTILLNLTVDHRVADGAVAAVFLGNIAELIETPPPLSWQAGSPSGDGARRSSNA